MSQCFKDCLWYIFTCGCCRKTQYEKKRSTTQKDYSQLTAITPDRPDPFADVKNPTELDTHKLTETYEIGPDKKYKTEEDVLKQVGYQREAHELDHGAFAQVFKAYHLKTKVVVALKVITIPPEIDVKAAKKRQALLIDIKNELFILQQTKHPHIIKMITHFMIISPNSGRECLYIVMQFASGGTLTTWCDLHGPFDEESCRVWFGQMLDALSYMHGRGVAHRDLKFSNILLDDDKDILISDFGLSRIVWTKTDHQLIESTTFCGTPPYMAPELLEKAISRSKDKTYNALAADVWALGVIVYRLFNKEYPFPAKKSRALRRMRAKKWDFTDRIRHPPSAEMKDILRKMFTSDPSKRPTMEELKQHDWCRHLFPEGQEKKEQTSKTIRLLNEKHKSKPKSPNS